MAGVETDENGNIVGFNPAKFAMGFLGGSLGSKSIERLAKNPKARAVMERIYLKKDIMPKIKQGNIMPIKLQTQQGAAHIKDLRNKLKEILEPLFTRDIINESTGLGGIITKAELNKMQSTKAIQKSLDNGFSKEEHFQAAQNIQDIYEKGILIGTYQDYKQNPNIKAVHRFATPIIINGREAFAKTILFERVEGKNKIYTIELDEISPIPKR